MKATTMMKTTWMASLLACALAVPAWAANAPKILFERTVHDFGSTSLVQTVTGTFKFKNTGDGVLRVETPKPSCGCTVAGLKPDTLQPGESGELSFTMDLGRSKAVLEKHIAVASNDPETPEVLLTIRVDYTPLYDVVPTTLAPVMPLGGRETNLSVSLNRTDGKPLGIERLVASQPWIKAKVETGIAAKASSARVFLDVEPDGPPRHFNEYVHVYATGETNGPVAVIYVYGKVTGDLLLAPEALYWSVTDPVKVRTDPPEELVTRRIAIRSADGRAFALKNAESTLKDVRISLIPQDGGKTYELVATLAAAPAQTMSGNVSFETSVASQPRIEVPFIINVSNP